VFFDVRQCNLMRQRACSYAINVQPSRLVRVIAAIAGAEAQPARAAVEEWAS
jgi:hypothetical protein